MTSLETDNRLLWRDPSKASAMKLCFLVDYRSPISRSWISYFLEREHEVHVISTCPVEPTAGGPRSLRCVSIGLGTLRENPVLRKHLAINGQDMDKASPRSLPVRASLVQRMNSQVQKVWRWAAPYEARVAAPQVSRLIQEIRPDLVHAMRIPFEAILGAHALAKVRIPFLVSVWGNDFTLHATQVKTVAAATRFVLKRANALHADCERDVRLAREWGLDPGKPSLVVPGNGGVRLDEFRPGPRDATVAAQWDIPIDAPVVLNARRFRPSYVRNDTFFAAIPAVLERVPNATFVCVGMRGNPVAESWIRQHRIAQAVRLLPSMERQAMATLFQMADVAVSPSNHDGTPNTLLEAMACGAFPIVGDVESVREWIADGRNGLLCNPNDVDSIARALVRALGDDDLRRRAAAENRDIVVQRGEFMSGMRRAESFYHGLIGATAPAASPIA